jgi:interferon gamma-inducible protein 30
VARLQVVWGNAKRNADGSVTCQHGPDECKNNILEGCAVVHYPETKQVRGCSHAQA